MISLSPGESPKAYQKWGGDIHFEIVLDLKN